VSRSALILAGGSGTRFWPLSRRQRPKQLLRLEGEVELLVATVRRLSSSIEPERIWISTTETLAAPIAEAVPEVPVERILVEPCPRNTAPAVAWAIRQMPEETRSSAMAVLHSDHRIAQPSAFRNALDIALGAAETDDRVIALGVVARWAETGYGYLEVADSEPEKNGLQRVACFREKPDQETADRFLAGGKHLWNAGMFVFRGETLLAAMARLAPEISTGLELLAAEPELAADRFARLPAISIDHAVMERLEELWTLPIDCGWDDLGSWQALYEVLAKDADGNAARGEVISIDARDNLFFASQGTIAALGVEGLVVVRTGDAVLVLPRRRAQEVRRIVEQLERNARDDLL
jgi:mannose-1-phosphate guanylyltransferase